MLPVAYPVQSVAGLHPSGAGLGSGMHPRPDPDGRAPLGWMRSMCASPIAPDGLCSRPTQVNGRLTPRRKTGQRKKIWWMFL